MKTIGRMGIDASILFGLIIIVSFALVVGGNQLSPQFHAPSSSQTALEFVFPKVNGHVFPSDVTSRFTVLLREDQTAIQSLTFTTRNSATGEEFVFPVPLSKVKDEALPQGRMISALGQWVGHQEIDYTTGDEIVFLPETYRTRVSLATAAASYQGVIRYEIVE